MKLVLISIRRENHYQAKIEKKEKVIYSNFGTFYTILYPSKVINHPKLGKAKQMIMLPTNAIKWMPSENVKDLVKNEMDSDEITAHGAKKKNQAKEKFWLA